MGTRGYFDSGYYVPLIIKAAGKVPVAAGRTVDRFAESINVMPSVLDWLDLPITRQGDGVSLQPWVHGGTPAAWREEVHWEYDFRDVQIALLERELGIKLDQCQLNVIRDKHYKYVQFTALPPLLFAL